MKMSEVSFNALSIISENAGIGITEFSKQLWPDNKLWNEARKDGKGKGYKMIRTGQSYLNKLLKHDLIKEKYNHSGVSKVDRCFFITEIGKESIINFQKQHGNMVKPQDTAKNSLDQFLSAEKVLLALRKGELVLDNEIYHLAFDDKISSDDLSELEQRCAELGYSYKNVEIRKSKNRGAFFVYPMERTTKTK
ncbi:MAG: hypothetical protein RL637_1312 [Pseudomonadota bacterium]|jgi:DNA-binding PadR family transcriptional regulator